MTGKPEPDEKRGDDARLPPTLMVRSREAASRTMQAIGERSDAVLANGYGGAPQSLTQNVPGASLHPPPQGEGGFSARPQFSIRQSG